MKILSNDISVNIGNDLRISVFMDKGKPRIGLIGLLQILSTLSQEETLLRTATEVEENGMSPDMCIDTDLLHKLYAKVYSIKLKASL